ncbi:mandelate racemase [Amaricoccus solimangrovi]|uniref:Mandelate racemase n=2 Tax=Amaricoccus solimangrovi TaxID=2589815 RepID=A0A501WLE4_9RHOB|nr:mandelate racemase [Amaricoccus solimangrovi]
MSRAPIRSVRARAFTIPTDAPESDGTLEWRETTLVLAEIEAGGMRGLGYTYSDASAGKLIEDKLAEALRGEDALDIRARWTAMRDRTRNLGQTGLAATAISAVDNALWDLKGKLLGLPVAALVGRARREIRAYGSGGFTSYDDARLAAQLGGWAEQGCFAVKMKVGRKPGEDRRRMRVAREAIGAGTGLFIDANGAFDRKSALAFAEAAGGFCARWFEEPVSSNDLAGLRLLRDRAPAGMAITTGEYAFAPWTFRDLLGAGAVDVLQADATRCLGITGFLDAAALALAHEVPLSAHCAPALHLHACLAAPAAAHLEWFHDHVRIEAMLFDGAPRLAAGLLRDNGEPGLGLAPKEAELARFAV